MAANAQAHGLAGAVGGLWHLATHEHRGEQVPWSQWLAVLINTYLPIPSILPINRKANASLVFWLIEYDALSEKIFLPALNN